jgi:nicotinamidase/pyrazinamidase
MSRRIHLLAIDPQNDFCDVPVDWQPVDPVAGQRIAPALPVAGAHADMLRLAALVRDGGAGLSHITVTLDSHHRYDIAHPTYWQRGDGGPVSPFTPITAAQVRAGEYLPKAPGLLVRTLAYLDELEARGRYTLMVWPVHCEIGTWGHGLHAGLRAACAAWEDSRLAVVEKVFKGTSPWTEHYSAVQAEVPLADDPATQVNQALVGRLATADLLLVAGEAGSHCVRATTEHLLERLPAGFASRVVLLTDCMSPVGGFEARQAEFFAAMRAQGVQLATSADLLPELRANACR